MATKSPPIVMNKHLPIHQGTSMRDFRKLMDMENACSDAMSWLSWFMKHYPKATTTEFFHWACSDAGAEKCCEFYWGDPIWGLRPTTKARKRYYTMNTGRTRVASWLFWCFIRGLDWSPFANNGKDPDQMRQSLGVQFGCSYWKPKMKLHIAACLINAYSK